DVPGHFMTHTIDRAHKVTVSDRVRGLLEFPEILGQSGNGGGRIKNNLSAVQPEPASAFGKMPVITDVNADARIRRIKRWKAQIAGLEIKFFPEAWVDVRNVMFSIFAEILPIGVNHRGGVVVDAGDLFFVDGN